MPALTANGPARDLRATLTEPLTEATDSRKTRRSAPTNVRQSRARKDSRYPCAKLGVDALDQGDGTVLRNEPVEKVTGREIDHVERHLRLLALEDFLLIRLGTRIGHRPKAEGRAVAAVDHPDPLRCQVSSP